MKTADHVLLNGSIYSISIDNKRITGQAIAIKNGIIEKIGSDEEIRSYIGGYTEVIDCRGNTIFPGLCDAHCHPAMAASNQLGCDLYGIYIQEGQTADEVIDLYMTRLKKYIDDHPEEKFIRGVGWVAGNFTGDRVPNRHDIDKICSDRPVVLDSFCLHNLWTNTKALELAGIDEKTPDVYAGEICRDEKGFPNGLFREPEAMAYIKDNVPGYDYSVEAYKEALLNYQQEFANKYGVTFVQDCMHSDNARQAYKELAEEDKLTMRVRGVYMLEPGAFKEQLPEYIERKGTDNVEEDFRIDTIKIFAEGQFVLTEPYENEFIKANSLPEGYKGTPYWKDADLTESMAKAMDAGFSVHVHAMGDGSVKQAAGCLAQAKDMSGTDGRHVIAHNMLVNKEDAELMGRKNIIANCQPRWMVYDSDIEASIPMLGKERAKKCYPFRMLLDENITVAFGTDFPVTPPPDTMHEIQCALTRSVFPDAPDYGLFKQKVLGDEKPATLEEAVKALSINGAYQMMAEQFTGSIEEGKSAELVILNADIEEIPPEEIYSIKVSKTIFKGNVVYDADKK